MSAARHGNDLRHEHEDAPSFFASAAEAHGEPSCAGLRLPGGQLTGGSALAYKIRTDQPIRELSYGKFKKMLARGEIRSVKVGPTELTGGLKSKLADGRAERFRTSRVGMERDEDLASLLDRYVPDGNYEAEPGPSLAQSVVLPSLMLAGLVAGLWIVLHRSGGMGSAMAFARSKPRVYGRVTAAG